MLQVFINAWMKQVVLLPGFWWSRCSGRNERNNNHNLQNIFVFNSQWLFRCSNPRIFLYSIFNGFSNALTPGTLTDGNRHLTGRNMGFLRMPYFLWSNLLHESIFHCKKKISTNLMWPFLFLILKQYGIKNVFRLHKRTSTSQFVFDGPKENSPV